MHFWLLRNPLWTLLQSGPCGHVNALFTSTGLLCGVVVVVPVPPCRGVSVCAMFPCSVLWVCCCLAERGVGVRATVGGHAVPKAFAPPSPTGAWHGVCGTTGGWEDRTQAFLRVFGRVVSSQRGGSWEVAAQHAPGQHPVVEGVPSGPFWVHRRLPSRKERARLLPFRGGQRSADLPP